MNATLQTWSPATLNKSAFSRFAECCAKNPSQIAVIDENQNWTYEAILLRSLSVANRVANENADPIAIMLPSSGTLVAAMMGALASGSPYIPLDPEFPVERNRMILAQSGATKIIGDSSNLNQLLLLVRDLPEIEVLDIDMLTESKEFQDRSGPESIAYIIYTSGSTGTPKGVYQNHRGLLHDIFQYSECVHPTAQDRLSWIYSASVNGALRDIYAALFNGSTLVPINARKVGLSGLAERVSSTGITILHAIPPLLRAFMKSRPDPYKLASVRLAYVAGDRFFKHDLTLFYSLFKPGTVIYNGIGSTECATLYRHWFIDPDQLGDNPLVPVGKTIPDRDTRIIDPDSGKALSAGEIGEVEVSSPYISLGYWRNHELTKQCFQCDPQRPDWRKFKTGDLAREQVDGLYEYFGRKDGQIKIRGYRVELGAIEGRLRELEGLNDAAVILSGTSEMPILVAFITGEKLSGRTMHDHLHSSLPSAFIPQQFIWMEEIPRLANFKLDLKSLNEKLNQLPNQNYDPNDLFHSESEPVYSDNIYEKIKQCWAGSLNLKEVDVDATFSHEGGDSLTALSLIVALEKALNRQLPLELINSECTVTELFERIQNLDPKDLIERQKSQVSHWKGERITKSGLLIRYRANSLNSPIYWVFNEQMEPEILSAHLSSRPVIALRSGHLLFNFIDKTNIDILAQNYVEEIISINSGNIVHLGGNCQGAVIAQRMSELLIEQGFKVAKLYLMELPIYNKSEIMVDLIFGDRSKHNPYQVKNDQKLKELHANYPFKSVHFIDGEHGQYFAGRACNQLAKLLRSPDKRLFAVSLKVYQLYKKLTSIFKRQ